MDPTPRRLALLAALLLAASPAPAARLKAASKPKAAAQGFEDRSAEFRRLREGMAGAESKLAEVQALALEEAAADDEAPLVSRRDGLIGPLLLDLNALQKDRRAFIRRNEMLLYAGWLSMAKLAKSRKAVDADGAMTSFAEADELDKRLKDFTARSLSALQGEQAAFDALQARSEVRRQHRLRLRGLAGSLAAASLLALAAWALRRRSSLAALALLSLLASPAPAARLKASPEPQVAALGPGDRGAEFRELRAGMAGIEPLLKELHGISVEESQTDDVAPYIPRRQPLISRLWELISALDRKHAAFVAKNRALLFTRGTALLTRGKGPGGAVDPSSDMAAYVEGNDLEIQLDRFGQEARKELEDEQSVFNAAQGRTEARMRDERRLRLLAAGLAAAALVAAGAWLLKRRRSRLAGPEA